MSMVGKKPLPIVQQRDEISTFPETAPVHFFLSANGVALHDPTRANTSPYKSVLWNPYDPELETFTRVSFKKKVFSSLRRICDPQSESLRRSDPEQPRAYIQREFTRPQKRYRKNVRTVFTSDSQYARSTINNLSRSVRGDQSTNPFLLDRVQDGSYVLRNLFDQQSE